MINRIYSIYRLGRIFNFLTLTVGTYSRLGHHLIFSPFSQSRKFIFQQQKKKTNKNKSRRCTKAKFKHDFAIENSSILIDSHAMNLEIVSRQKMKFLLILL